MSDGKLDDLPTSVLLGRYRNEGDQAAFGVLYERHKPVLLSIIRLRAGDRVRERSQEEDILHDVFVKALSRIETFHDRGPKSYRRWINTILIHHLKDLAKRKAFREEHVTPFHSTAGYTTRESRTPSTVASDGDELAKMVEIVRTLPEADRRIFTRVFFEERTYKETATELDLPTSTVFDRYAKLLGQVRAAMDERRTPRRGSGDHAPAP